MSIWDKVKQRHALKTEISRLQALANRGLPGHEPKIAQLRDDLRNSFNSSPQQQEKPFVPYSAPPGSYGFDAHLGDRNKAEQESGGEIQLVRVPVTVAGYLAAFNPFYCDADGLQLLARTIDDSGASLESSDTARIFIKINNPGGAWIPLGYGQVPQGGFKGDATVFSGTLKRFWVQVQTISQDPAQTFILLALLRHVSIVTPAGASGLYGSPSQQQGAQQINPQAPGTGGSGSGTGTGTGTGSGTGSGTGTGIGGGGGTDRSGRGTQ